MCRCQAPCLQFHSSCCWWLLSDADKAAHHASPPPTARQHQRPSPHRLSHNPTSLYILPSYPPQALDDVQAQLDLLSGSCTAISSALATARVTASGLLGDADKAARQLAALDSKGQLVEEFLVKYQLTPEEVRGYVDVRTSSVIVCRCCRCSCLLLSHGAILQGGRVGMEFWPPSAVYHVPGVGWITGVGVN